MYYYHLSKVMQLRVKEVKWLVMGVSRYKPKALHPWASPLNLGAQFHYPFRVQVPTIWT